MRCSPSRLLLAALAATALGGCFQDDDKAGADDTGAVDDDAVAYVYDPGSVDVAVSMQITTQPERPWRLDLQLVGDDLFSERFAAAEVNIRSSGEAGTGTSTEQTSVTTSLSLESVELDFVGATSAGVGEGEGTELTALSATGEAASMTLEAPVAAADCADDACALASMGTLSVPGAEGTTSVAMGIDAAAGDLHVRLTTHPEEDPLEGHRVPQVYGIGWLDGPLDAAPVEVQTMSWGSGDDLPTGEIDAETTLEISVTLYDRDGERAGGVTVQGKYGDIIIGSMPLDDFYD